MTKTRSTKSALISSVIALLLCFTMLLGTTFAWFTDSVTSANNVIKSGNLDIELDYWDGDSWETIEGTNSLFTNNLWEPGHTEVVYLKLSNLGSLALKYQLAISVLSETEGTNVAGDPFKLSDYIQMGVVEGVNGETNAYADREAAIDAVKANSGIIGAGYAKQGNMLAGDAELYMAVVVYMPETVGNEANAKTGTPVPTINLGVQVLATQYTAEGDSFDDQYDKDAWVSGMSVYTAEDLQAAINAGENVTLMDDITLDAPIVIPASATTFSMRSATPATVIDLNGKTITGNVGRDADGNRVHVIVNNGNAVIKNGVITSAGVNGGSAIYNADGATLTVENVTLNGAPQEGSTWPSYTVNNYGTLTVSDSSIYGVQGIIATNNTANTTVNNVIAYRDGWSSGHVFYNSSTAKVTINGGTYTNDGNGVDGTIFNGGETVVNGGTFIVKEGAYFALSKNSTLTVNGGDFSNIKKVLAWGGTMSITGGTFGFDPSDYVADGYAAIDNSDGTYTVARIPLSLSDFLSALENANYDYDGEGVTVVLKDSEYNHYNNTVRQFYIPASTVNISSDVETITIKNVVFTFEDDDTSNTYVTGELQTLAKNVTFEGCTFDNVSVSPWETTTGANDCASATFTGCTWINLTGRYGVHQSKAAALTVTGCTFNSQRGIHVNTVSDLDIRNNTFNGIGDSYGVLCLSEGITTALTSMDVSGNIAVGQTMLRQLSNVITYDQVCSIFTNNVYGEGKEYVAGSIVVKDPSYIYLTAENYATTTIESNTKYALEGDFGGNNVALTMPAGVENVIFDGSKATNINELIIVQNGKIIDNANDPIGERSGNVTVQNFNVLSQINVFACKTEVVVQKNTAEALMIHAGNCAVKVLNNTIDANFESHPTYRDANNTWNTNNYGIALNIFDYNLWLDGNTVTDAIGHAIGINGWETTIDNGDENVIESFKGNTITVNSTTNTKRAAFKVWDDETYASNDDDTNVVNETTQAFIDAVLADGSNTFNIIDGYDHTIFSIYNVNTNN